MVFSPTVSRILGVPSSFQCKPGEVVLDGEYPINMKDTWDPLFIYLDAVEPTLVGHTEVKLLQCIPVSGAN